MKSALPEIHSEPDTIGTPHRLLTVREAAAFIGRTKGWLDKARCNGSGPPFHRIGRRILYSHTDLTEWLEARRFASTSEYGTRAADAMYEESRQAKAEYLVREPSSGS